MLGLAACSGSDGSRNSQKDPSDNAAQDRSFPGSGQTEGKEDVFGRSLIGAPNPYPADLSLSESTLKQNMRKRREVAWRSARKVLEPVELLSLKNRAENLPDCAEGVETRALSNCEELETEQDCRGFESNGHGICTWNSETESCDRACDNLTLPDGGEIPEIPRWQTWYGIRDISRIFRRAYDQLDEQARLDRASLSDTQIGRAFHLNNTAVERSNRWPLWRYTETIMELFGCELEQKPDESDAEYRARCAASRQSQFSGAAGAGGGISRVMYSPAAVLHTMRNYAEVLDCRDEEFSQTWCGENQSCDDPPENFSTCFRSEFPEDVRKPWESGGSNADPLNGLPSAGGSVFIKASWKRVGFGFDLPAFDTSGEALAERIGEGERAFWGEEGDLDGDRTYEAPEDPSENTFPGPKDIYTIETRSGQRYRLTGLHIMTKELRHWMWITLWWSDKPDKDFGADRPESFDELPSPWSNYKMCVVVDYRESDDRVLERFDDYPTLQKALAATDPGQGKPTWCSNPYIEHGGGNARTNCIGCHQHAGTNFKEATESTSGNPQDFNLDEVIEEESAQLTSSNRYPANGRTRRRTHFPTDYSWTYSRLDNLTELIREEVEHRGTRSDEWQRRQKILNGDGDPQKGKEIFENATENQTCTDCHGNDGLGGGIGPNLQRRFSQKTDWQLLSTIIDGQGQMPAWGERLSDTELTDLLAHLRAEFGE